MIRLLTILFALFAAVPTSTAQVVRPQDDIGKDPAGKARLCL
jgi:hypothetical protein